ncbi:MAG: ABC transporter permease [Chloroflexota bacterium]
MSGSTESMTTSGLNQERTFGEQIVTFLLHYGAYLAFMGVLVYFSIESKVFLTPRNIIGLLQQVAVLAVVTFGLATVVMGGGTHVISGGIDLSLGALIGLLSGLMAVMMRDAYPIPVALGAGLLTGLAVGAINGSVVVYLRVLPLLATLAMMYVLGGVELLVTNNLVVSIDNALVSFLADTVWFGIPVSIYILLAVFLIFYIVLHETRLGVYIQAIGGNKDAAVRSGLGVQRLSVLSYVLAGFAAWVSAILVIGRLSGSTRGIGPLMLLDIILATYVSAMFSRRQQVNVPGAFLGALFVAVLSNGFTMINVPTYWTFGVKGLLVLTVVAATSYQQKRKGRR